MEPRALTSLQIANCFVNGIWTSWSSIVHWIRGTRRIRRTRFTLLQTAGNTVHSVKSIRNISTKWSPTSENLQEQQIIITPRVDDWQ